MADPTPHRPGTLGWTKALTLQMVDSPIAEMTAPGGRGRASVRIKLEDGRNLVATRRENADRGESEAALLQVLSRAGASVPQVYGYRDGLLLQSDAGRERLSWRMATAERDERLALAQSAVIALETCRRLVAGQGDLLKYLPGLGARPGWTQNFVARPVFLSGDLQIGAPQVDTEALAASIESGPDRFTRWEARMANAAVQPDGSVMWFDWEYFGRRSGLEDIAWLLADPAWTLDLAETAAVLSHVEGLDSERGALLRRLAVLIAANRLTVVHKSLRETGWPADPSKALRLDRPVTTRDALRAHCLRMAEMTGEDPLVAGFGDWFTEAADAMSALKDAA